MVVAIQTTDEFILLKAVLRHRKAHLIWMLRPAQSRKIKVHYEFNTKTNLKTQT